MRIAATLWLALAAAPGSVAQPVREEVLVREVELLLAAPRDRGIASDALKPAGLMIEEDGVARTIASVAPLAQDQRWEVVVYLDQVLTDPVLAAAGALAAAAAAEDLAKFGTVDVIVADPEPRTLVSASRDGEAIATALGAIAVELLTALRRGVQAAPATAEETAPGRALAIRRQSDRLVGLLGWRGTGVPRLLVLVADGMTLSPGGQSYAAGSAAPAPAPGEAQWLDSVFETSRTLGALGWTIALLLPREEALRFSQRPETDYHRFYREVTAARLRNAEPRSLDLLGLLLAFTKKNRQARAPQVAVQDAVDLRRASVRAFATETGGVILSRDGDLPALLPRLSLRWLLAFQSPSPRDGREHRVRVRSSTDGRELEGQRWTGSVLESVTAARLRLLLAGEVPAGKAPLAVAARRDGGEVAIEVAGLGSSRSADLRLAAAFVTADGDYRLVIRPPSLEPLTGASEPWRIRVPKTATKLAVVAENVRLGTWAGALTAVADAAPAPAPDPR